jgi:hypothetical protein
MKRRIRRKYWNLIFKEVFNNCHMNGRDIKVTCSKIRKYRKYLQRMKSYHQRSEDDYRSGYETYGYKSIESIDANLTYISDRFGAGFRLAWLVNVPEEVDRLMDA